MTMRERGGRTLPQMFAVEKMAVRPFARLSKDTMVQADESPAWNPLHAKLAMCRINHQHGYSIDGACTSGAESYFSRLRSISAATAWSGPTSSYVNISLSVSIFAGSSSMPNPGSEGAWIRPSMGSTGSRRKCWWIAFHFTRYS